MIRCLGYDSTAIFELRKEEVAGFQRQPSARLWLDLDNGSADEISWLQETFGLQPQNVADLDNRNSPDYIDAYPAYLFGSAYHPRVQSGQLYGMRSHYFLFPKGLITVHGYENEHLESVWQQYGADQRRWQFGLDQLLIQLIQGWNRDFGESLSGLQGELRALNGGPAGPTSSEAADRLIELRREFSYLRQLANRQASQLHDLRQQTHPALDALSKHRLSRHESQIKAVLSEMGRGEWWADTLLAQYHQNAQTAQLNRIYRALLLGIALVVGSLWLTSMLQYLR